MTAGERLDLPGPAKLRVSAEGVQAARLAWRCGPATHGGTRDAQGPARAARVELARV
ncbi:hypothetical protein [Acidovorax sp. SUPP2825]|uniref:hypothetical protein n=1 Tax=Acidovorax sp. SUPP2825 TaxID=2920879 RepID=UPI0032EA64AD